MYWRKMLVLALLSDLVGPELASQKYQLPVFEKNEKIYHFCGKIRKEEDGWFVQMLDGRKEMIRLTANTKIEQKLNISGEVHVFAEERELFNAVAIVSDKLYGLTSGVGKAEEKMILLLDYLKMRPDHQRITREFLQNRDFRTSMTHFFGFAASNNKLEQYYGFPADIQTLAREFNAIFAKKLNLVEIDYILAETLLSDLIGDMLFLNSNTVTSTYSWPHLLAGYSLIKGASVWQIAYDTVGEVLLNKLENHSFIPVHFLAAVLSAAEAENLVDELIRFGKGKKKREKAGYYLVHIVRNKSGISNNSLKKIEKFLFEKGVPDYILPDLQYLKENVIIWNRFLKYISRMHGEDYAKVVYGMVEDKQ